MEKRILFLNTNIGKIETTATVEEALEEVRLAKEENRLAKFEAPANTSKINDGEGNIYEVRNVVIKHLDLNEVKIYSYEDNNLTPIENKKTEEEEGE